MDKDESSRASGRTTRSFMNFITPNSKALPEVRKASTLSLSQPSSIKDLVFRGESLSLDEFINLFPGRRAQIIDLVKFWGPLNSPTIPYLSMEVLQWGNQANLKLYSSFLEGSGKSIDQKEAKDQEILMKGPGTSPLDRLLAIYECISSVGEYSLDDDDEQQNGGLRADGSDSRSISDNLLQLSSLCSANFITNGGRCPLEGSTRATDP